MQIPGLIGGLLLWAAPAGATVPPVDSVEQVMKDLQKAYENEFTVDEAKELIDRCFDIAAKGGNAAEQCHALGVVLTITSRVDDPSMVDIFREASGNLVEKFVDSPVLGEAVLQLPVGDYVPQELRTAAREALDEIAGATKSPDVQAACAYVRLSSRLDQWEYVGLSKEENDALIADVRELQGKFPEVQHPFEGKSYGEVFKGILFKLEHLSIGAIAPDIEGEDVDGVAFKLSDYSGKVVMLDFWGDW